MATAKAEELAVYLALHSSSTSGDTIMEALWPAQPPQRGRLNNTVSRARRALGGEALLPKAERSTYRVSDRVTTDIAQFNTHLAAAAAADDRERRLRQALTLVGGQPFAGADGYHWAWTEGTIHQLEALIADTAHTFAQLASNAAPSEGRRYGSARRRLPVELRPPGAQ